MTTTDPEVYTIRQGSTAPSLTITPERQDGSTIDVTGATVRFLIRDVNLTTPLLIATLQVLQTNPAKFRYTPSPGDTGTSGEFLGEVEVVYNDDTRESFPTTGFIPITIVPSLGYGDVPQPGGKSGADWIAETRSYLAGSTRDVLTQLNQDIDPDDQSFTLTHDTPMSLGDRLCVGMETMHVWSYDQRTRTVQVQRGVDGTQPLAGASGTLCQINPRFSDARIWQALQESLSVLQSAGMYQAKTLERTADAVIRGFDLAADLIGDRVLEVAYLPNDSLQVWREAAQWEVFTNVDTATYPSGRMLFLATEYVVPALWPVRITYQAHLGVLRSPADEVAKQTGLPVTALDVPPLYAAVRLLAGEPVRRANPNNQPTGRRPDEVTTGDIVNSGSALRSLYATRLQAELTRLKQQYPYRQPRRKVTR